MLDEMIQMILDDAKDEWKKRLNTCTDELSSIRAGRATPAMLENIKVDYYGSITPLNQMASVTAPQADLLVIQPWDASSALGDIEKPLHVASNLGVNPSNDGNHDSGTHSSAFGRTGVQNLLKRPKAVVAKMAAIAIRNIRRQLKDEIKSIQQSENLPEDMRYEGRRPAPEADNDYIKQNR